MKETRSEFSANIRLEKMKPRQQFKGTIQKISEPKYGMRIVAETLFYCALGFVTCYLFVYAIFN